MITPSSTERPGIADAPRSRFFHHALFIILIALYVGIRLRHGTSVGLSFDEIWSLQVARLRWSELLPFISAHDFHPPFFYILLKAWMAFAGESLRSLGLFPALTAIAALGPLYMLFRALKLTPAERNAALFLVAVNGFVVGFAQELRMYDLLLVLSTSSLWLFVGFCTAETDRQRIRLLVALTVINTLMVYTQYFGWLLAGAEFGFLLLWDRRRLLMFTASAAITGVAFSPWAFAVVQAGLARAAAGRPVLFHISPPGLFSLAFFYATLDGDLAIPRATTIATALFGVPIALWCATTFLGARHKSDADRFPILPLLTVVALGPVLLAFTLSQLLPTAVWGQRHFMIIVVPYLLLVVVAASRLRPAWARPVALCLILIWAGAAGWQAERDTYKRVGWDVLAARMKEAEPDSTSITRVFTTNKEDASTLNFQLDQIGARHFEVIMVQSSMRTVYDTTLAILDLMTKVTAPSSPQPLTPESPASLPLAIVKDPAELPGNHFWVADQLDAKSLGEDKQEPPLSKQLAEKGFRIGPGFVTTMINRRLNEQRIGVYPVWRAQPAIADGTTSLEPALRHENSE